MRYKPVLNHEDVKRIAAAAEAEAVRNRWAVAIVIVDDGGHLLFCLRLDGAPLTSSAMAQAKAHTAAVGRRESVLYERMIMEGKIAMLSLPMIKGMLEGGVPIIVENEVVGAVGVSGVLAEQDVQIARAGISALIPG